MSCMKIIICYRFEIDCEIMMAILENIGIPTSIHEAPLGSKKEEWMKTMKYKMRSMNINLVWDVIGIPKDRKTIGIEFSTLKKMQMNQSRGIRYTL